ncbi:MAG: ribosome recycling factor [Candidatus Paceibacterota bacterium]|jgi:ribosome recycling factor
MNSDPEQIVKDLEGELSSSIGKLKEELSTIRSGRPSVEFVENIRVSCYGQEMTIKQLGSLSVIPPRTIQISVWDKASVGAVMKGIEDAKIGMSASNDGNLVRANLPVLTEERREEVSRMVKKMSEGVRIQVRNKRDEAMKKLKAAADDKEISEDQSFKFKEKIQKVVDENNGKIETMVGAKLEEIKE